MLTKCTRIRRKFDDFHDGRVDEATRARVDNHLAACRRCAEEYTYMCRVVYSLRSLPRPKTACASGAEILARAGVLTGVGAESDGEGSERGETGEPILAVDAGDAKRPTVQMQTRTARIGTRSWGQLAAAALLIGGLVVTHGVAFFMGDRKGEGESLTAADRALAELGKDELPSIIEGHLDKATKLVSLAEVEPDILPAIARDDVVRVVRHTADRLQTLGRAHPTMKPLRPQLERYGNALERVLRVSDSVVGLHGEERSTRLRGVIDQLKVEVRGLQNSLAKQRLVVHGLRPSRPKREDGRIETVLRFIAKDFGGVLEVVANARDDRIFRSQAVQFAVGAVGAKRPYRHHASSVQRMLVKNPGGVRVFFRGRRFGASGRVEEIEEDVESATPNGVGVELRIDPRNLDFERLLDDELRGLIDVIRVGLRR